MKKKQRFKTALVLGGGGARGWAHLGVLHALEERGMKPDLVVGTSMGGLVGAAYAAERWLALEAAARQLEWRDVMRHFIEFNLPHSGLVDGQKILEFLRKQISSCKIEEMKLPFIAVATDVYSGDEVILREGDMLDAIRATIAVPGIFTPVVHGDRILVDGGLVNPVPVSVARAAGAKKIIAVDINHFPYRPEKAAKDNCFAVDPLDGESWAEYLPEKMRDWVCDINQSLHLLPVMARESFLELINKKGLPSIFDVLGNSIRIMETHLSRLMLKNNPPDILIRPDVGHVRFMDFHCVDLCIKAGRHAANKALDAG